MATTPRSDPNPVGPDAPRGLSSRREALTKLGVGGALGTALWVAPSVIGSTPAMAWGSCTAAISSFPTTNAATNSSGWTRAVVAGTFSPGNPFNGANGVLGIQPSTPGYLGLGTCFLAEDDPTVLVAGSAEVTYTTSVNVVSGQFYRFSFQSVCTAQNQRAQILDVLVGGATQTLVAGSTVGVGSPTTLSTDSITAFSAGRTLVPNGRPGAAVPVGSNPGVSQPPATYVFVYTATTTGAVNFQYRFRWNTAYTGAASTASDDIAVTSPTIECSLTGT